MHISVIGTGYVGLVSGVCLSELGFHVTCVDRDARKIDTLKGGHAPFYEPGLAEMMAKNVTAGRLHFVTSIDQAETPDVMFIAVGTPPNEEGLPDMRALWSVVEAIDAHVKEPTVIVVKSTMPPGTTREVGRKLPMHHAVSNPEFLREGSAIADFMAPDRIVCGVSSDHARSVMEKLYAPLAPAPLFFTSPESSEMIKYTANDLLATRIAYINEIADICEKLGADVTDVAKGIGMDKRIGPHFLRAGPGFGGSCFPKDVLAMVEIAKRQGVPSKILEATFSSNEQRKTRMAEKIVAACGGSVKGKTLAVLGVTFKPDTDDMREAPSLAIVPTLQEAGATVRAFDPEGMEMAKPMLADVQWCADAMDCLMGADAAIIITEWGVFKTLELAEVKAALKAPLVIDLRNIYDPAEMKAAGLNYVSIGRAAA